LQTQYRIYDAISNLFKILETEEEIQTNLDIIFPTLLAKFLAITNLDSTTVTLHECIILIVRVAEKKMAQYTEALFAGNIMQASKILQILEIPREKKTKSMLQKEYESKNNLLRCLGNFFLLKAEDYIGSAIDALGSLSGNISS
jgi:hypothetical protein